MQKDVALAHVTTMRLWSGYWQGDAIADNSEGCLAVAKLLDKAADAIATMVRGEKGVSDPASTAEEEKQIDAFRYGE